MNSHGELTHIDGMPVPDIAPFTQDETEVFTIRLTPSGHLQGQVNEALFEKLVRTKNTHLLRRILIRSLDEWLGYPL